ncbi:MAG: Yip1 family protein [Candidatus Zixiibacteriota bacterium]
MEEMTATPTEETKPIGQLSRIGNLFFDPVRTFRSLDIKPSWLWAFIIVAVVALISSQLLYSLTIKEQLARISSLPNISAEQLEVIKGRMMNPTNRIISIVATPIGVLLMLLVVSGVLYFVFSILLGGNSSFKRVLSVYTYSSLIAIPSAIVTIPLAFAKGTAKISLSPALLLSAEKAETFLGGFLSQFSFFALWQYILVSVGLSLVYKFSKGRSFVTVAILWVIASVVMAVLSKFGRGFGLG